MQRLTLGDITFGTDPDGLVLTVRGREEPITLSKPQVEQLEAFLRQSGACERRVGFRVPVASLPDAIREGFRVQIRVGARILLARCIDLSLTGIQLEVAGLTLRRGMEVPIRLNLDDLECRTVGSVVRYEDDHLAMHFPQAVKNGELDPPAPLLAMYRQLETEYLRLRREEEEGEPTFGPEGDSAHG
ncbi:MAG TPA: PilZ domain-containing protein [Pseudomonadales bacterium]